MINKTLSKILYLFPMLVLTCWPIDVTMGQVSSPNFIVILTDDQRMDALGANGNDFIITPSLDKLAKASLVFTQANVVFSLCSPSRAAILTGRYGSANGVLKLDSRLGEHEKSLAQYLQEAGYLTAFSGKWHLPQSPNELGFDQSVYFKGNGAYYRRAIYEEGHISRPAQHCDEYCVDWSMRFLEKTVENDQPFFLFHCTQLPHMDGNLVWNAQLSTLSLYDNKDLPVTATRKEDLSSKPPYLKQVRNYTKAKDYGYPDAEAIQKHTKQYYAVITEMDAALGRLIEKTEKLGLMHNTYIIFMSDNGWMLGEHGFTSKVLPYRPSTSIPFFIHGPDITAFKREELVLNIDVAPTILDLAGGRIPEEMHGNSIKPLLSQEKVPWRNEFVYEGLGIYGGAAPNLTVFDGRFRYIQTYSDSSLSQVDFIELYDNKKDIKEQENLANDIKCQDIVDNFKETIRLHQQEILKK
ncbi:sulfatase-like hydrolase/transferase [Echinicola sp. 20G]|uniref:sulfatase-like hydrolase/transferase n=1 Tax=Echinicola sp. 20G TaxID=2781961 RepID=UPI0019105551|nr:sulfatase-like hydrolase/transferase [Echinicola sp. 20G]